MNLALATIKSFYVFLDVTSRRIRRIFSLLECARVFRSEASCRLQLK